MKRKPIKHKKAAAKKFNDSVKHTKAINVVPPPMRGGYRL